MSAESSQHRTLSEPCAGHFLEVRDPPYRAAACFGLPPSLPLALAAARLALLRDWPPVCPSLEAIHFFEPRKPSKSPGT